MEGLVTLAKPYYLR